MVTLILVSVPILILCGLGIGYGFSYLNTHSALAANQPLLPTHSLTRLNTQTPTIPISTFELNFQSFHTFQVQCRRLFILRDSRSAATCQFTAPTANARRDRNARMVEKLQKGGIPITLEELADIAGGQIISRAHFARLLVRKKVVSSIDTAFKRFLGKGMPYYEPRACLALPEATRLIREAGGVAVIAHPISLGLRGPALRTHFLSCKDQGVAGIEAWHPNQPVKECRRLERLARSLGMIVTGGSDFHGENIPQRRLGYTAGGREIPDELLDALPVA